MVKLTGPGMAQKASGSIADTLTFSELLKRPYLKTYAKPLDTKTENQLPIRAGMGFLGSTWKTLSLVQRKTWLPQAELLELAPYHAWVKLNMERWRTWRPPSREYPATETGYAAIATAMNVSPSEFQITVNVQAHLTSVPWGYSIIRVYNTWPGTPQWEWTVLNIITNTTDRWTTFVDEPPHPGDWFYRARPFNDLGKWGLWGPIAWTTIPA
jgi:hypothetical protein